MNNIDQERVTQQLFDETQASPKHYDVYLSTHPGKVRSGNEDNFAVNTVDRKPEDLKKNLEGDRLREPLCCAVFDGMGGEAHGEIASQLSAGIASLVYYELLRDGDISVDDLVRRFVTKSNRAIVDMLASTHSKRGGSTFVMAVMYNGVVYPYSIGDSRIYLFRDHHLSQISNDQTLAMKKLRANIITEEEALTGSDRHKLTSFLGADADDEGLEPQIYQPFVLRPDDKLLLCSDGLYDMCSDAQMERLLHDDPADACLGLMDAALENGGEDNITCILITCCE